MQILLVEGNSSDAQLVEKMLKASRFPVKIAHVSQLAEIKSEEMKKATFDLVLLNLNLLDSQGLDTLAKAQMLLQDTPIVVLADPDHEELSLTCIQAGAQDYLVKGKTNAEQLIKTIQYALARYEISKKINRINKKEKIYLNTHDMLTRLPNQSLFLKHLQLEINKHTITRKTFALLLLQIHEMDKIVSHFDYMSKDEIIKTIASHLTAVSNKLNIFLAHYSASIFVAFLPHSPDVSTMTNRVAAIQNVLTQGMHIADQTYFPSYSIGIATFPFDGNDVETLIKNAQTATEEAAELGIQKYKIYTKQLTDITKHDDKQIWESDLQFALEREEFFMLYQPQVDTHNQKIRGLEALLRWNHPRFGLVSPEKFIPIAEDCHLIKPIGIWVLETVAAQYHVWQNQVKRPLSFDISINVSAEQLKDNHLIKATEQTLNKCEIPPTSLTIELTESILIVQPELMIDKLNQFKNLGIQIAIDDFGTAYSSLSYLSHLPITQLKLDKGFIKSNQAGSATETVVRSIIDLAHSLGLLVIAEGVETKSQLDLLKQQNCDRIQGYFYSKPLQASDISQIL